MGELDARPPVAWRDLLALSRGQVWLNVGLSWPWLLASWYAAARGDIVLALPLSFFFFLCALRQAHDCYHRSIGLGGRGITLLQYVLSVTMFCSTHAIRHTHLQHHRAPLSADDVEGGWARLPAWRALLCGPWFSLRTQWQGLRHGDADTRRRSRHDGLLMAAVAAVTWAWPQPALVYHLCAMLAANAVVGFFAVWLVHHGCDAAGVFARTERRRWLNLATAHLLYHIEHHLFPQVPANHLPELARRLDRQAPQWTVRRVWAWEPGGVGVASRRNRPSEQRAWQQADHQ